MVVLTPTSPTASPAAPKALPTKYFPSANARTAFMGLTSFAFLADDRQLSAVGRGYDRIDDHLVPFVRFGLPQLHAHALPLRAGNMFADVIGLDRHLAVAAVDQHRQAHRLGTRRSENDIQGVLDGSAGENDIVHQDDLPLLEIQRSGFRRLRQAANLLTGAVNFDLAGFDPAFLRRRQFRRDALRQMRPLAADAEQQQAFRLFAVAKNLPGDFAQGAFDRRLVHEAALGAPFVGLVAQLFGGLDGRKDRQLLFL